MRPKTTSAKGRAAIQKPNGDIRAPKKQTQDKGLLHNRNLLLSLVLIITFIVFLPTLSADFIETWDDGVYVTDNTTIIDLKWQNLKAFFTEPQNGTYVPLPMLSFALEYKVFGLNPLPFHLNNLLLHLLCTAFAFYILRLLRLPVRYAALGALLFGIHPMRVETVAWVTERKDLLFSVFYLGAIITYIKFILSEKGKLRYFTMTLVLFVFSLFSKIQAVSLPLALLLLDYYLDRPLKMKLIWEKIPFFALSLGFGILGYFILQQAGSLEINEKFSLFERILFGLFSLSAYLLKLFAPLNLSAFYPYPIKPGESMPFLYYLAPLFLLLLAALVYLSAKKTKAVVFGSLFFLVNIMFLLQILGAGQGYQADRFTYIPYLGLFFLAAWAAQHYTERSKAAQPLLIVLVVGFSVFFAAATYARSGVWKNSLSLWTDVIEKYPGKIATAYSNRASSYRKAKQPDLALADYNVAISLDRRDGTSRMNRGNIHFDAGRDSLAFQDYRAALLLKMNKNKEQTEIHKLYGNLGAIYGRRGVYDSAFYYLDLSLATDSTFAAAWMNRGLTNEVMGRWENAIADFSRYLRYNPDDEKVHSDIGVCYQNLGKFRESLYHFDRCVALKPATGFYYLNRSYSYNALKETDKARQDALKARELGHQVPPAYLQYLGIL
jgi:tetratricopeptide (TPR) repeat protein